MERPGVGVAVAVFKEGKVLLGLDHGKGGVYGVPGGHWESGESLTDAARREVLEESGIEIGDIELAGIYTFFREDKQRSYLDVGFKAKYKSGKLKDEPGKRTEWAWFDLERLPENIFDPDRTLLDRVRNGPIWKE